MNLLAIKKVRVVFPLSKPRNRSSRFASSLAILLIGNYFKSITMKIAILFASFAGASAFVSQAPKSVGYVLI
jgi:hypothetical protein